MKAIIYPGTFDPPHLGHLNIIQRSATLCDKLIIAIGTNRSKPAPVFSFAERKRFFETMTAGIANLEIVGFDGLLVDFAKSRGVTTIVRAFRTMMDFEYETVQGQMNRQLGDLETFYLLVDERYRLISSTLVREIASYGKSISNFVPKEIETAILQKLATGL